MRSHCIVPGIILAPEILCDKKGKIILQGFHLDKGGMLTKSGIIQVNNIKTLEHGFYTGIASCCGFAKNKGFSSFFPQSWSLEKIAEKIVESFHNLDLKSITMRKGSIVVTGKIQEGRKIITAFKDGIITTCYPKIDF
ncbi:MAG: EndoU domain-containing protein [Candidatus Babeliaceae bacterium]